VGKAGWEPVVALEMPLESFDCGVAGKRQNQVVADGTGKTWRLGAVGGSQRFVGHFSGLARADLQEPPR